MNNLWIARIALSHMKVLCTCKHNPWLARSCHTKFPVLIQRFLFDQLNLNPVIPSTDMIVDAYPVIEGKICTFNAAVATFYAPSDNSGVTGMHCEYI